MQIKTIEYKNNSIKIIDQRKLPERLEYIYIRDIESLRKTIRKMQIRGAPVLGVAVALGVYLGMKNSKAKTYSEFKKELDQILAYFACARPTAKNTFWALERMKKVVLKNKNIAIPLIKKLLQAEAEKIIREDKNSCRKIGDYGCGLINNKDAVLTICNAGILATVDYGTALGILYRAKEEGKKFKVYACETRPMLQGARLTTWELKKKKIDVTLICDSMAATLMRQGKINKVIVGADRIASNGDTANKVGTYNLAVLSLYHKIPFYVAAPSSTFDLKISSGKKIPIEERDPKEITELFFKKPIAVGGIKVFNPAFDITPHYLITAIITDRGIIKPPYKRRIFEVLGISKC